MINETKQVSDQMNKVVDQFSNYTNDIFGLFSTITKQMENITHAGIESLEVIVESGQKTGKDLMTSSCSSANEAVKVAKSCIEGPLNLIKQ